MTEFKEGVENPEIESKPLFNIAAVDDEGSILKLIERMVRLSGGDSIGVYDTFTNPKIALEAIKAEPDKYNVLLTDGSMPGMSGFDLADQVKDKIPAIVLISGGITGVDLADMEMIRAKGIMAVVEKPVSLNTIKTLLPQVANQLKK